MEALELRVGRLDRREVAVDAPKGDWLTPSASRAAPSSALARAELAARATASTRAASAPRPSEAPAPAGAPATPAAPRVVLPPPGELEDILGGRVLAWVGGVAVLLGVVFLLVVAVSRGWLGEEARVIMAAGTSLALLGGGVRLHERRGRTDAALAATAAGVAGLFATLVVATQAYGLFPPALGATLALPVGAAATVLAIRWRAVGMGALGIVGALLAPVLVGAEPTSATTLVLGVAALSAAGVLLWQRWSWLAALTFLIATPQWLAWLLTEPPVPGALAALVGFGVLGALLAVGYELRSGARSLPFGAHGLLVVNALVLAAAGWHFLSVAAGEEAGELWLAALAFAHLAAGLGGQRLARVSHALALAATVLGVLLADVAFALMADGLPLVLGWAGTTVGGVALLRRARGADASLVLAGVGGHLALALGHALAQTEGPSGGPADLAALAGLGAVVGGCLVSGRLAEEGRPALRVALDALGLGVLAYGLAVAFDGVGLTLALAAEAVGLAVLARRARDEVALGGTVALAGLAASHALAVLAPPEALAAGPADLPAAVAGLGAAILALLAAGRAWAPTHAGARSVLDGLALAALAYLLGVALAEAALTVALASAAVGLAVLARRGGDPVALGGTAAFAGLGAAHALVVLAPPEALLAPPADLLAAVAGLGAVVVALVAAGRAWERAHLDSRDGLDGLALAALAYLLGVALDGAPLTVALAAVAIGSAFLARRLDEKRLRLGALLLAGTAALHALVVLAPPVALLDGLRDVPAAAAALLAAASAVALAGERRPPALALAGVLVLHLASTALVSPFQGGGPALGELDPREQGQALLSGFWALVGVVVLVAGLVRDDAGLRRGALALLTLAVVKVFLYDLASLSSLYRVGSFVGLGALLLCGAFAWQRLRPRALPDLRDAAPWSR